MKGKAYSSFAEVLSGIGDRGDAFRRGEDDQILRFTTGTHGGTLRFACASSKREGAEDNTQFRVKMLIVRRSWNLKLGIT